MPPPCATVAMNWGDPGSKRQVPSTRRWSLAAPGSACTRLARVAIAARFTILLFIRIPRSTREVWAARGMHQVVSRPRRQERRLGHLEVNRRFLNMPVAGPHERTGRWMIECTGTRYAPAPARWVGTALLDASAHGRCPPAQPQRGRGRVHAVSLAADRVGFGRAPPIAHTRRRCVPAATARLAARETRITSTAKSTIMSPISTNKGQTRIPPSLVGQSPTIVGNRSVTGTATQ